MTFDQQEWNILIDSVGNMFYFPFPGYKSCCHIVANAQKNSRLN